MIAALPMYAHAATAAATARLWSAIRQELGEGPEHLLQGDDLWAIWEAPDLLLSQTCGLPYRARLRDGVRLVGTPDYGLEGCAPGWYRSVYVARRGASGLEALSGKCFALNDEMSQSGWAAPSAHFASLGLRFGPLVVTGAHAASARAVAEGAADLAALDAQSWRLISRHEDFAAELVVVGRTPPAPGLPLITGATRDPEPVARAVAAAIAALDPADRDTLGLRGLVRIPPAVYFAQPLPVPLPEAQTEELPLSA